MPQFDMKQDGKHALQHDQIHDGLERFDAVLAEFKKTGQYDPKRLREVMDSFKTVLFEHLDEEVESLSADSMRRYWSLEVRVLAIAAAPLTHAGDESHAHVASVSPVQRLLLPCKRC